MSKAVQPAKLLVSQSLVAAALAHRCKVKSDAVGTNHALVLAMITTHHFGLLVRMETLPSSLNSQVEMRDSPYANLCVAGPSLPQPFPPA